LFRYPQHGGTGSIFQKIADRLPQENLKFNASLESINVQKKIATVSGEEISYDKMISTIPLDILLRLCDMPAGPLSFSSTHIIGIGIRGTNHVRNANWLYFPGPETPFYRATIFSRYGAGNAPDGCWSLLLEVSQSKYKTVGQDVVEECVQGCLNVGLLKADDILVEKFHQRFERGYPTPTLGLHEFVIPTLETLKALGIYSRGRFGAWLYQVSNMDHSVMQGAQAASNIMHGSTETVLEFPGWTNSRYDAHGLK
jgi:protoporphyrinogen oxidase